MNSEFGKHVSMNLSFSMKEKVFLLSSVGRVKQIWE